MTEDDKSRKELRDTLWWAKAQIKEMERQTRKLWVVDVLLFCAAVAAGVVYVWYKL